MKTYVDASVLVSLFALDPMSDRAEAWLRGTTPALLVSDFATAEVASAIARRVRSQGLTADEARAAFASFDAWTTRETTRVRTAAADIAAAEAWLRRLDLTLRTPDAVNIAIAQRLDAALATFDAKMSAAARALGVEIAAV